MPFSYANSEKKNVVLIPVAISNGSSSKTWPQSKVVHTEYLVLNSRPRWSTSVPGRMVMDVIAQIKYFVKNAASETQEAD